MFFNEDVQSSQCLAFHWLTNYYYLLAVDFVSFSGAYGVLCNGHLLVPVRIIYIQTQLNTRSSGYHKY